MAHILTKLFRYQTRGVHMMDVFEGRVLLADEMGLGKTIQVLTWFYENMRDASPMVVVCPASLKINWKREALKHIGVRSSICRGRTPPEDYTTTSRIIIINYDILPGWIKWLRRLRPQLVVMDECHAVKNRIAQRTKCMKRLIKNVPYVMGLSGTPLTNRPAEMWSALNMIRPDIYKSFPVFAWAHCKPTRKPWGWEFKGATNLSKLHADLRATCMIRRLKADVLKDLPTKSRHVVAMPISDREQYKQAEEDFIGWLKQFSASRATKAKRADRLVQLGYLKRLAAQLKLPSVMEWVDNFLQESDGKLILFAIHKNIIKALKERYKHLCVVVDGSVTGHARQEAVDLFQSNRRIRLLIGNIGAAGVGLNMTSASTVALAELPWTPSECAQGEDRAHRIGQLKRVFCYYLIATGTIEETLCELIQEKQVVCSATLDGGEYDDIDIFDRLTTILTERTEHGDLPSHQVSSPRRRATTRT